MTEHGYSVFAEYAGEIPAGSVGRIADETLARLERVTLGPVVAADERGIDLRFSLVYDEPRELDFIAGKAKVIAVRVLVGVGLEHLVLEALHVETDEHQERELEEPNFPKLVGLTEIADLLRVSRQRVSQLREHPDFPKPLAELRAGDVWSRESLNNFVESWPRRGGRQRTWSTDIDEETIARARESLSDRELVVLTRVSMGADVNDVAVELGISPDTVRRRMREIFGKLERTRSSESRLPQEQHR